MGEIEDPAKSPNSSSFIEEAKEVDMNYQNSRPETARAASGVGSIGGYTLIVSIVAGASFLVSMAWSLFVSNESFGASTVVALISGTLLLVFLSCRVRWSLSSEGLKVSQMVFSRKYSFSEIEEISSSTDMQWKQGVGYRWSPGEWAMVCGSRNTISLTSRTGGVFSFSVNDESAFMNSYSRMNGSSPSQT